MNGKGKLTETENAIFYASYEISYVILKRTFETEHRDAVTDERKRNAGNQA